MIAENRLKIYLTKVLNGDSTFSLKTGDKSFYDALAEICIFHAVYPPCTTINT
jgi:hypothetical protein